MIGRLPLREHIAREMFADYKLKFARQEKDKSRKEWDDGTAFHTTTSRLPWLERAEVAIQCYEEWHRSE